MAEEVISRDENFKVVGAAISNDADQEISMLRMDSTTKELLIDITIDAATSANSISIASRDQNFRPVCLGWDETNQVLQEILTDENGYLLCDVTFS